MSFVRRDSWLDNEGDRPETKRLRRQRSGGAGGPLASTARASQAAHSIDASEMHDGPSDVEGLLRSPLHFCQRLRDLDSVAYNTLVRNIKRCAFHSHYSGCGFDFASLKFIAESLVLLGEQNISTPTFVHACDIGKAQQRALLGIPLPEGPQCVFDDMEDRLPRNLVRRCQVLEPTQSMRSQRKQESVRAYEEISNLQKDYFDHSFDAGVLSPCLRHERLCPVFPEVPEGSLLVHSAGIVCKDFSTFGARQQLGGRSAKLFSMWKWECNAIQFPVVICECAPALTMDEIAKGFSENYIWHSVVLSPELFGFPAARKRRFTIGIDSSRFSLMKPISEQALICMFGRKLILTYDVFFCAPTDEICEFLKTWASKFHLNLTSAQLTTLATCGVVQDCVLGRLGWRDVLALVSPSDAERLRDHENAHNEKHGVGGGGNDGCVCDFSQNPCTGRSSTRGVLPTLTCSAKYFSTKLGRPLLPKEHFIAQGVRAFADTGPFQLPWAEALVGGGFSESQLRALAGNGQNLCNVVPLHVFVLGHLHDRKAD